MSFQYDGADAPLAPSSGSVLFPLQDGREGSGPIVPLPGIDTDEPVLIPC